MSEKITVLIIDDDQDYRASTRALLEAEGHEVIEATGGVEGLAAARQQRPDLIILDVIMEHLGEGYSINQVLKTSPEYQDLRHIPILMVSSIELDPASLYGWLGDASPITPDAYMSKPLNIPEFLQRVRELLKR